MATSSNVVFVFDNGSLISSEWQIVLHFVRRYLEFHAAYTSSLLFGWEVWSSQTTRVSLRRYMHACMQPADDDGLKTFASHHEHLRKLNQFREEFISKIEKNQTQSETPAATLQDAADTHVPTGLELLYCLEKVSWEVDAASRHLVLVVDHMGDDCMTQWQKLLVDTTVLKGLKNISMHIVILDIEENTASCDKLATLLKPFDGHLLSMKAAIQGCCYIFTV